MKKIYLIAIFFLMCGTISFAQNDQRTLSTKIADLLAQMPAKDSAHLIDGMKEIAAMGQDGLTGMAALLSDPGKGDNTKPEYAINGFSYYATQPGREDWRKMSEKAYCQALEKVSNKVNKAFIISQLQIVGQSDDVISCLKNYLNDEQLCDPAARALIKVNSPAAKEALLSAAQNSQGNIRLSLVEALGDSRYSNAVPFITSLANGSDSLLNKVALYSLANIADPSSAALLSGAAQKSGFTFEKSGATDSYLLFLNRLAENGENKLAEKMAASLIKNIKPDNLVHTRIAAMTLFAKTQGDKNIKLLSGAASDKNSEYRAAALKIASENLNPATTAVWLKKLKKSSPEVKAEIITMLGNNKVEPGLATMTNYLSDKNADVRLAAIGAVGRIGGEKSLPVLLNMMKTGSKDEVMAVKNAIDIMSGDGIVNAASDALPAMPEIGKAALVSILGSRGASGKSDVVFPLLKSGDADVRKSAFAALKTMATKNDLPQLFSLLKTTSQPEEVSNVQDAVIAAIGGIGDKSQQSGAVLQEMAQAPDAVKPAFYRILASIGNRQSLDAVVKGFENGNADAKASALNALSGWNGNIAADALYNIGKGTSDGNFLDRSLRGYVRSVVSDTFPDAEKLLMLRKAMEIAKTVTQKRMIIREAGRIKVFNAMIFAGEYLNDAALQQDAARAVMSVALSDKKYYGDVVRNLLNKTSSVLKGGDSDYEKQAIKKFLSEMPAGEGWVPLFNGNDLSGWKGLVGDPLKRAKMDEKTMTKEQQKADDIMRKGWYAEKGVLHFTGKGENICTVKKYGDFEMFVDWKITKDGDAGVYLRGTPQVQIWDTARRDVGAEVGSGGLYNNQKNPSKPLKLADNAIGDWNNFHIIMKGDRVTVYLNGELVTDNVILENFWDKNLPIFSEEQIELQAHGTHVAYRDIYIREISSPKPYTLTDEEKKQGFKVLFDGTNMYNWTGATDSYVLEDGNIVIHPNKGRGGNLFTKDEYSDFNFRFEFMLTPGANNGLGIRAPLEGDAAYKGMELQILDNDADVYKKLHEYQYHGSVYGVIAAKRGFLKPLGEWNYEEVIVKGPKIKVILNGTVILDGDITEAREKGTLDGIDHPGLKRTSGHIGFLGHGSLVRFKNIRVKDLSKK